MKKFTALAIVLMMITTYVPQVFAIENIISERNQKIEKANKKNSLKNTKITPVKNKFEYINLEWWKSFDDQILDSYIIKAVENNKDLKIATLNIDEFYQKIISQRSDEIPTINAGFLPGYSNVSKKTTESFMLPIIASYEIDLFGKNHNKTTASKKSYEASILDERTAYIAVASAVGSTYVNIVKLDAMIEMQTEIVDLRKEIYDMMIVSNAEGISSTSDLVRANQSYVTGITVLSDLKKQRTQLLDALAVLVGDSPNNIEEYPRIDWKKLSYNGNIPTEVTSDVIMQRPDYLKAEKLLEKAGIDVKIARKECLPSIILGGGYIFNTKNIGSLFTTSNALWGIGGGLLSTIFAGGKIKANLKIKKIAYEKSLKNYEKVNLTSMQEVNDALVAVNLDREKLCNQKEIQLLEQKDFVLTNMKYNEGVISKLDLNQRKENLLNVNKMVYASQFDCFIDYIGYYKAVGAKA